MQGDVGKKKRILFESLNIYKRGHYGRRNFIFGGSYSTIKDHLFYKYKDNDNYLKDKETVTE